MVFGICISVFSGTKIIGREYAANKSNDGQTMQAIIACRIDVPPAIAVVYDWRVEVRSSSRASAARSPASAAIGTPGPGWVLPPAR